MEEQYKNFTVEEFIQDAFFYEWVTAPTARHETFWVSWLHLYPEKRIVVEEARQTILKLISEGEAPVADYMEQDWQHLQKALSYIEPLSFPRRNHRNAVQWYAVAACFLLLLGFGLFLWWQAEHHSWNYVETAYGEQQRVLLPDGSAVILNGNSQLRYAAGWEESAAQREVWLDGEAFFQVTRQKKVLEGSEVPVKFRVHTSRMQVEVLGTEFNVRSRKQQTQVVLTLGSVLVHDGFKDSLLLQPGEMVELNEQQHHLKKREVNDKAFTSWKEQKLIFDNEEIAQIFRRLEDTYGWKIEASDTTWLQQHYTGSVPVDQIELLFDKLAVLYEMEVKKQDQKVWFEKK